jgi:hypothetical protein
MPELDWDRIRQGKDAYREKMAELPFEEKLLLLERLRERTLAFGGQVQHVNRIRQEPTSNIRVVPAPAHLNANSPVGVVNLGFFGAAATLVSAMAPAQSSAAQRQPKAMPNRTGSSS